MNLREWFTNDADFREVIDPSHRGIGSNPKVLGLRWNTDTDELFCTDFVDHCQGVRDKKEDFEVGLHGVRSARLLLPCCCAR